MGLLIDKVAERFGFVRAEKLKKAEQVPSKRNVFSAGVLNRLTNDWVTGTMSSDAQLRQQLPTLRARSRDLRDNEPYAAKFIQLVRTNVIGEKGVHMRMKARDFDRFQNGKLVPGPLDVSANKTIEDAWKRWGTKENCTVTGNMTWSDVQRMVIETAAVDGEILIRPVIGYPNEFGFALQLLESDHLDDQYNEERATNGNTVRMGVEFNQWRKRVAYHILTTNPADGWGYSAGPVRRERVGADEIIHVFHQRRPDQTRGVPWMTTAMGRLKMLSGYEEAEVVAARVAASKMGFFAPTGDSQYQGPTDSLGNKMMDAEPGSFEELPQGLELQSWDPQHPNSHYGTFVKAALRGVAAAWGVSYHSLANDLEGVNFSSGRLGSSDEREGWKAIQCWITDCMLQPVFARWLEASLTSGAIRLPLSKYKKFNAAEWRARRWQYIDPATEIAAAADAIKMGLTSRTRWLAEQQIDFVDIAEELRQEEDLADQFGINISGEASEPEDEEEEDEEDEDEKPEKKEDESEDEEE